MIKSEQFYKRTCAEVTHAVSLRKPHKEKYTKMCSTADSEIGKKMQIKPQDWFGKIKNHLNEGIHAITGTEEIIMLSLWRRKTKEKMNCI